MTASGSCQDKGDIMNHPWQRTLLGALLVAVGSGLAHAQMVNITEPIIGKLEAEGGGWSPIEILDVERFPVDKNLRFFNKSKTIFEGPEVGALIYSVFVPAWHTAPGRPVPPGWIGHALSPLA